MGPTHLFLFGSARGSLIVGRTSQLTSFSRTVVSTDASLTIPSTAEVSRVANYGENVISIAELELGMHYSIPLGRTCLLYFRGSGASQTYFGAGNASSPQGNLSLIGAQFTVGLTF